MSCCHGWVICADFHHLTANRASFPASCVCICHTLPLACTVRSIAIFASSHVLASVCICWGCFRHPIAVLCPCLQRVRSGLHKSRAKIAAERREEERALLARTQTYWDRGARHSARRYHAHTEGRPQLAGIMFLCVTVHLFQTE